MASLRILLPQVSIAAVCAAIVASSVCFLALAAQVVFSYTQMHEPVQPFVALFLGLESVFLWRLKPWALSTAVWCWGAIVLLLVFGCLANPFFWHEFPRNAEPFSWALPATYAVVSAIGLWCWYVLRSCVART